MADNVETDNIDHFRLFEEASDTLDADILYVNCGIMQGADSLLIDAVRDGKRRQNLILMLVTSGGSADVAYKMAKCLQNNYEKFSIFIPGWCKSAGTLIATGAHTIYFSDHGELGPLDIQLGKKDELDGYVSGLDLDYGIRSLRLTAFNLFEHFMLKVIQKSNNRITFKTSAEIAASLTSAYINKIAEQISPVNLGETVRMMTVAREYGERLNKRYENIPDDASLNQLVSGYSSHSFVIDYDEACSLFKRVEMAPPPLREIERVLGTRFLFPFEDAGQDQMIAYLRGKETRDDIQTAGAAGARDDDAAVEGDEAGDTANAHDGAREDGSPAARPEATRPPSARDDIDEDSD